ncbi:uncharacterized protein LOC117112114 [Anneissia japonica]|uniref:uncharacterized protein LOC117112114 n=1 Tax=Anneissia japonica TaxID=1529436 RepID=UPI0014255705|nr:uncharacterized protein LOC117112114 [Anneissia japonica]
MKFLTLVIATVVLADFSCGLTFNVEVKVDQPPKPTPRQQDDKGTLFVTLIGQEHQTQKTPLSTKSEVLSPGRVYTYKLTDVPDDLGQLIGVYLYWDYDADWYNPLKWDIWINPVIYVHQMMFTAVETNDKYLLCGSKVPIVAGKDNRAFFVNSACV